MKKELIGSIVMWIIVILSVIGVSVSACDRIYAKFELKPDNVIEEALEEVIEDKTGLPLDLTPESLEEPKLPAN